jgi:hypothetical protein
MFKKITRKVLSIVLATVLLCGAMPVATGFAADWGPWSDWSVNVPAQSSGREIETRAATVGYNMVVYVTQEAAPPYYRNFRGYSVNGYYSAYGLRASYGEQHYTKYITRSELDSAPRYSESIYIPQDNATRTVYIVG